MHDYTVRLAQVGDAEAAARSHMKAQIVTYEAIMPPTWRAERQADLPDAIERRREMYAKMHEQLATGDAEVRRQWVALRGDQVVGVCASGPGSQQWEIDFGFEPPPIDFQLDHLYLDESAFGSGLGQDMLDIALPNGKGAYLWILRNNLRAQRFYERNGFAPDGYEVPCGERWHYRPMFRMWRPDAAS